MLTNYLKTALRVLSRQKGLALINILGLSIGLACFAMFLLYTINELNYDRFHKNASNIYRVYTWKTSQEKNEHPGSVSMSMPLGPTLKKDLPDVVDYVRLKKMRGETIVRIGTDLQQISLSYSDKSFFSVFSFPLKYGNAATALADKNNIVITASKARSIFGRENVVGDIVQIKIDNIFTPFKISAVAEDLPANSTIGFEVLASFDFLETTRFGQQFNNWYTDAFATYVLLKPGSKLPADSSRLRQLHQAYYPDQMSATSITSFGLQPLPELHTDLRFSDSSGAEPVSTKSIWIMLSIAFSVLLVACINFATLSIARAASRGKEIGIRKVTGAAKSQLIVRFLSESFLLTIAATLLAIVFIFLLLPWFNQLTERQLYFSFHGYPELGIYLPSLVLFTALIAGSYPAVILSRFNPVEVLKNKLRLKGSGLFMRSMITIQFAVSIGLIISTMIILQQTVHMAAKHPGFNKENLLVIEGRQTEARKVYPLLKQELQKIPAVTGITGAQTSFGEGYDLVGHGFKHNGEQKVVYEHWVAQDYIKTTGLQLIAGRDFDDRLASDTTNNVIINESMMRDFGWTLENVIGQSVTGYTNTQSPTVIGVVKDFTFQSLSKETAPYLFHRFRGQPRQILVRLQPGEPGATLSTIQTAWNRVVPEVPFKYSFLDEDLDRFYKSEKRWNKVVGCAGGVSIFLACLGLFGLVYLAAINRIKEIGIRKVLGASIFSIIRLLSADFVRLILISLLIATPLTWYLMNQWLQDYAYRIEIQWWVFAVVGLAVIGIAVMTVCFHTIRAAIANPVKSLRTE